MAKLFCAKITHNPYNEEHKTEIIENVFQINGYSVGDRLLEDVMFDIHFSDNKVKAVNVEKDSEGYFSELNEKYWLREISKHSQLILNDGDEVEIPKSLKKKYYKNGINCSWVEP